MTKIYDICNNESSPIIRNWLGFKGLHFVQILTNDEQEIIKSSAGLFQYTESKI